MLPYGKKPEKQFRALDAEVASELLPTKHGWEQFSFVPMRLNEKWIAKSSTPLSKEEVRKLHINLGGSL